jgi:enoyl-CoA hydratase
METVLVERDGPVATVVHNRPARRNALDHQTKVALNDTLADIASDTSARRRADWCRRETHRS